MLYHLTCKLSQNRCIISHYIGLASPVDFEKEDEEGRLERRIPAPWEKEEEDPEDGREDRKISRAEERRKRKSMKIKNKEKIGNIDINVLQRELCNCINLLQCMY